MSLAKRVRKARMIARRAKRAEVTFRRAHELAFDMIERARLRAEINASDAPEALKTVLGYLVDPLGAAVDAANREMQRRKED